MKELIIKYLEGRSTEVESVQLLKWLREKENRVYFHRFRFDWEKGLDRNWFPEEGKKNWETIQATLADRTFSGWQRTRKMSFILQAAAIFTGILAISTLLWIFLNPPKAGNEAFSTIIAEKGQMSKVHLPDGSAVWLNSGSSLTYSNLYGSNIRKVDLSGEAFFEVKENQDIPFRVKCGDLNIQVLGTSFNISAYQNTGKIDVVLEKGAVELTGKTGDSGKTLLNPGEMASYDSGSRKISVTEVNTIRFTSWKEGILNIYNLNLDEVVKKLESRYNQEFEVEEAIRALRYTFTIKNETLSDILTLMEQITPVKAVQKGNKIHLGLDKKRGKGTG
jgi:ferric-dicitrate binding protein FerR (iron transport regulator)